MTILKVNEAIKEKLKVPQGRVSTTQEAIAQAQVYKREGRLIVTIGDRTTINFITGGLIPDLAIVDGREMRRPAPHINTETFKRVFRVENAAGTINTDISSFIERGISDPPSLIFVDGEEDLLGLLVCVTIEERASIFYGQPYVGTVVIDLTKDVKEVFRSIFKEISE